jgi:hypothetical protein
LSAKLERSAFRKLPVGRVPDGARVIRRLEGGGLMILDVDGRVRQQSSTDRRQWGVSWDERRCDEGHRLRWLDAAGEPRFSDPPASRRDSSTGRKSEITRAECVEWARLRDIPGEAVLAWWRHTDRRSRICVRDDVDIAPYGLAVFQAKAP